jgi:hypothetical protein
MSVRIKAVVDRFVRELQEALDADIQDRIMKEREMQSYIEEREREVAEREAAWKAELSRREVIPPRHFRRRNAQYTGLGALMMDWLLMFNAGISNSYNQYSKSNLHCIAITHLERKFKIHSNCSEIGANLDMASCFPHVVLLCPKMFLWTLPRSEVQAC